LELAIKKDNETITTLKNIAIGQEGAGQKLKRGDNITPVGHYRIAWINHHSPFYLFFGFDYPSIKDAFVALNKGLIDHKTYYRIVDSHVEGKIPPQNTVLGGQIGIHGLGKADIKIHQLMNWTQGCIALTNHQIDILSRWVEIGTRVEVK
jgi:murein L,D-transpeptidase YafK